MELRLFNSEKIRDLLTEQERRKIAKLYQDVGEEAGKILDQWVENNYLVYENEIPAYIYNDMEKDLLKRYQQINEEIAQDTARNMEQAARSTSQEFLNNLKAYGLPDGTYLVRTPRRVVENIINGTVYTSKDNLGDRASNWGLSSAIWGHSQETIQDIHKTIAYGKAQGWGSFEIAQALEGYVNPWARKAWDFGKVNPYIKKQVDYNAQRLARTLVVHAHQQAFKESGSYCPWLSYYIWHSVFEHGRTCPVCMDMDGNRYARDDDTSGTYPALPLDHPNGLCYWTYEFNTTNMAEQLAQWTVAEDGEYPDIDRYINYLRKN